MKTRRQRSKFRVLGVLPGLLLTLALIVEAQQLTPKTVVSSSAGSGSAPVILREIVDPATGDRWLLVRDPAHPGAPGQMVLASGPARKRTTESLAQPGSPAPPPPQTLKPVIRGGDPVVVEESTPVVEARFEGVALEPALVGAELDVRLKLSGVVLRARALAPGRVEIVRVERVKR